MFAEKKQTFLTKEPKIITNIMGVSFKLFEKLNGKLCHTLIGIPTRKYLFGPLNKVLAMKSKIIYWP